MSDIFVFRYTDPNSASSSSIRDYEIGSNSDLVGSNRHVGKNKRGFILVNDNNRNLFVGYVGLIGGKVYDEQPWSEAGGRIWKHIYTTQYHSELVELNILCESLGVDKTIFTKSVHLGHVRRDYIHQFNIVLDYFRPRYP